MVSFFSYRTDIAGHAAGIPDFLMFFSPGTGLLSSETIQGRRLP